MNRRVAVRLLPLAALLLQGCATLGVKRSIEAVDADRGALRWWDDDTARVVALRQICGGAVPEYAVPGAWGGDHPVRLRLDPSLRDALFHDDAPGCADTLVAGPAFRLVVAPRPWPLLGADSAVLVGSSRLGSGETLLLRRPGALPVLKVRESLHPGRSAWGRSRRWMLAAGYVVSVPVDLVLSPLYLVGGVWFLLASREGFTWH